VRAFCLVHHGHLLIEIDSDSQQYPSDRKAAPEASGFMTQIRFRGFFLAQRSAIVAGEPDFE
jgi:hypothetical protein